LTGYGIFGAIESLQYKRQISFSDAYALVLNYDLCTARGILHLNPDFLISCGILDRIGNEVMQHLAYPVTVNRYFAAPAFNRDIRVIALRC
jgi:hypothetical protein